MEKLTAIVRQFKDKTVVVVGDLILDQFVRGSVERLSPEAPVPVILVGKDENRLGGAGNVAANVRALGGRPVPIGVVGHDASGEKIQSEMERLGISTGGLLMDMGLPTTTKTRIIAGHQQVCRVDRERPFTMSEEMYNKAAIFFRSQLKVADAVVVSDYGKGFISARLLSAILSAAEKAGKIVAVDPKNLDYSAYGPSTVLTPNKREAEHASGVAIRDEKSLRQAAEVILKKAGARHLLVTRGEEGMSLFSENGFHRHIPTFAREVYDVTGAGDTAIAALTLSLCAGADPESAAVLANYAAGVVVGKLGTACVFPGELVHAMKGAMADD